MILGGHKIDFESILELGLKVPKAVNYQPGYQCIQVPALVCEETPGRTNQIGIPQPKD